MHEINSNRSIGEMIVRGHCLKSDLIDNPEEIAERLDFGAGHDVTKEFYEKIRKS